MELLQHYVPAGWVASSRNGGCKTRAIAINARVTQASIPLTVSRLLQSGLSCGIVARKVKRTAFSIQRTTFTAFPVKRFGVVNRHRQRRHANPALRCDFPRE